MVGLWLGMLVYLVELLLFEGFWSFWTKNGGEVMGFLERNLSTVNCLVGCLCQISFCSSCKQMDLFSLQQQIPQCYRCLFASVFLLERSDFESAPSKTPQKKPWCFQRGAKMPLGLYNSQCWPKCSLVFLILGTFGGCPTLGCSLSQKQSCYIGKN